MHSLPKLSYPYDALESYIDAATMKLHYTKHHQSYVDKLNDALSSYPELLAKDIKDILVDLDSVPEDVRTNVRNNGGGHYNHSLFWELMTPEKQKIPDKFKNHQFEFNQMATTLFGSGWAWMVVQKGEIKVISTPNQDSPISQGLVPILGIDVWEHAYYLKYKNKRADYINAWWNVVNWSKVQELYEKTQRLIA